MRIQTFFTLPQVQPEELVDQTVVVIDVLRSSTTICTALQNGVRSIVPVVDSADAIAMQERLGRENSVLGGERDGRLIPGFDLGNSPAEYLPEILRGKSLTFVSSNGTPAIARARTAVCTVIAGMVNITAVVNFLSDRTDDITIICAGKSDRFSIDDAVCAGMIINKLMATAFRRDAELNDAGRVAAQLGDRYAGELLEMFQLSEHGRYLSGIGMGSDLQRCAEVDTIPVIPVYKDDHIVAIRTQVNEENHDS